MYLSSSCKYAHVFVYMCLYVCVYVCACVYERVYFKFVFTLIPVLNLYTVYKNMLQGAIMNHFKACVN